MNTLAPKIKFHLSKDPVMKTLIEMYPAPVWEENKDLFLELLDAIVSQQLSVKASATIYNRFKNLFKDEIPTPEEILKIDAELMRKCGISYQKIKYMKSLSEHVMSGSLDLKKLNTLNDEEVITDLTQVKGIGKWTAEMILIFSLHRPDIFSMGDLGLRNAVARLYNVDRDDLIKIGEITKKWKPYRSFASRYLWMSLDNKPLEKK